VGETSPTKSFGRLNRINSTIGELTRAIEQQSEKCSAAVDDGMTEFSFFQFRNVSSFSLSENFSEAYETISSLIALSRCGRHRTDRGGPQIGNLTL
jgi:hypothetical protein